MLNKFASVKKSKFLSITFVACEGFKKDFQTQGYDIVDMKSQGWMAQNDQGAILFERQEAVMLFGDCVDKYLSILIKDYKKIDIIMFERGGLSY